MQLENLVFNFPPAPLKDLFFFTIKLNFIVMLDKFFF